jgi:hypothetical protein
VQVSRRGCPAGHVGTAPAIGRTFKTAWAFGRQDARNNSVKSFVHKTARVNHTIAERREFVIVIVFAEVTEEIALLGECHRGRAGCRPTFGNSMGYDTADLTDGGGGHWAESLMTKP